ncbi:MAG: TonB-dependent receptor [Deltaproteobacteria bacterium]|nr:TonB-dependent receptor [Deltaproteobacteria bacterium]
MKRLIFQLVSLLCLLVGPLCLAEDFIEIDRIVIQDQQPDQTGATQANVLVDVTKRRARSETVADVLSEQSGVRIKRYGGLEGSTAISIRGSSSEQVRVFLDGIPLGNAAGEGIGLDHLSSEGFDRISIFKSFSPSEFGASAVGGVVSLVSKKTEQGWHARSKLGFGSFLTGEAQVSASYGGDKNDLQFGFYFRSTEGNFSFLDNNGTPLNPNDDARVKRQNNHQRLYQPHFKWQHRFDDTHRLSFSQRLFRINHGVPGLANFQAQNATRSLTESLSSLRLENDKLFGGPVAITNLSYLRLIKSQFADPNAEIGLGATQDNDNLTAIVGNRFQINASQLVPFDLKITSESIGEYFLPKDYDANPSVGDASKRYQINVSADVEKSFFEERFFVALQAQSLNAFYRVNNNDPSLNTPGTFFSSRTDNQYALSLATHYKISPEWVLKASVSRNVRLPLFVEMFGDQGNVLGNPQLRSESALKYDAGFLYDRSDLHWGPLRRVRLQSSFFDRFASDLIQFELASGYARASNIGKARVYGVETSLRFDLWESIKLQTQYTFQQAKDRSAVPGNYLVGLPVHEWDVDLSWAYRSWETGLHLNYIDKMHLDRLNTQRVNHRVILNFDLSYRFLKHYKAGIQFKNLTNSQVVDAVGFPLPGRSVFGFVQAWF